MNKKLIILLSFISLIGILSSCEKDGTDAVMVANPQAPEITTIPDLTLERVKGTDTLTFEASEVNPGFTTSATYFLEACATGNDFANAVQIYSGIKDDQIKITVGDLNQLLLKILPEDQTTSTDFRIRAILTIDAGTGSPGTGTNPFEYTSDVKTINVTVFGLLRLDLIGSGSTQKIVSPLGDGNYESYVKLDPAKAFTLSDPDNNISYGGSGGTLAIGGAKITVGAAGWYDLKADTKNLTYSVDPYMIGLVGSATPNGWNTPDQKMDYDAASGTWSITLDLIDGDIKFRKNDGWAWNLGGTTDKLTQGGDNITVSAGNYTITLTIINDATGTFTIVKN